MHCVLLLFAVGLCSAQLVIEQKNPDAFEGDIGLDPSTRALVNGNLSPNEAFKGIINRQWPDNRRRTLMNNAMGEYHRKTCVRFVQRRNHRNYVHMVNQNACWSIIGRGGGKQLLKMGNYCLQLGTAIHELMHAVGFYHEQSRYDRDDHVKIFWNNIQSGESYNFQKYRSNYYGQTYDLNSIMHYRNTEFSRNRRWTIQSIKNPQLQLGNTKFSERDLKAINLMYNCGNTGTGGTRPPIPCTDDNARCGYWASIGECNKNPNWMLRNCKLSCKQC